MHRETRTPSHTLDSFRSGDEEEPEGPADKNDQRKWPICKLPTDAPIRGGIEEGGKNLASNPLATCRRSGPR